MKALPLTLIVVTSLLAASPAAANGDRIQDYGVTPAPSCPTVNHPPNPGEVAQLITCAESRDDFFRGTVYRTYNVHVQVAGPRAYTYGDPGSNEADSSAPVYPIRGSKSSAVCSPVSDYMKNAGKNCFIVDSSGSGICYKTPFGDWKCRLGQDQRDTHPNSPPPG